jgi:hypothetical protein
MAQLSTNELKRAVAFRRKAGIGKATSRTLAIAATALHRSRSRCTFQAEWIKEVVMTLAGGCHCGSIRYRLEGDPSHVDLCHCADCRRNSGAPVVCWAGFEADKLTIEKGAPKSFNSSGSAFREFCPNCGTGLFYRNPELLPGIVEVQSATLDDPEALPPHQHIQAAERLQWMELAHELPSVDRFPDPA